MARRRRPTCAARAAFASKKRQLRCLRLGTPTARRPYHFFHEVLPHQHPRGSATVPPKVGMARRRRPIFAATPPSHPETATPLPEAWDPDGAAALPIFTRCCRTKSARQRGRSHQVGMARREPPLHPRDGTSSDAL
jgi:hypothetical protein